MLTGNRAVRGAAVARNTNAGVAGMNPTRSPLPLSRRAFLLQTALAGCAVRAGAAADSPAAEAGAAPRFPLIGFSKPFQALSPERTAEMVAAVGWDGVEMPVRARGQVEPERAPDDLPGYVDALRRARRDIYIATTDITSIRQPHAETVLRTAARLGIKRVRLGPWMYRPDQPPADRLKEIAPALRDLADACRDLGLQAGVQNHSGRRYVGAPVWDVYSMIRDLDPRHIGMCFDIGHATVEGGLSWPIEARLMEPFYTAVYVKDFVWKKEADGWKESWCPLGEGMVSRTFFDGLRKSAYRGPISQHHEYELGDERQMLAHMQRDLRALKAWLEPAPARA